MHQRLQSLWHTRHSRAYDALVVSAEQAHQNLLGSDVSKASEHEFQFHFEACMKTLKEKPGKQREQQIRDLFSSNHPNETVANFAHRFWEIQHELDKRIPRIHCDLELIYAFLIKLREDISRQLFSQEFNLKTLQELITAAQRYETRSNLGKSPSKQKLSDWQPAEFNFIGPSRKKSDFSSHGTPHTKPPYGSNFKHNNKYKTGQHRNQSTGQNSGINKGKS